jgi:hypothetical protein
MGVRQRNEKEELRAAMRVQGKSFFARSGSVRATNFLCTKFILKTKSSGATRARSLCFILVVFSEKILLGAPTYNTALLFTDLCTPLFSFI